MYEHEPPSEPIQSISADSGFAFTINIPVQPLLDSLLGAVHICFYTAMLALHLFCVFLVFYICLTFIDSCFSFLTHVSCFLHMIFF